MIYKEEYYLKVDWHLINKKIKKQPNNVITRIKNDITRLRFGALNNSKIIDSTKNVALYKKRYNEIDMFYTIENEQFVVVLDIKEAYLGTTTLNGVETSIKGGQHKGKKTTQQEKTIKKYKNKFSDMYK